jgi:lipoate-protein ligase A
LIDPDASQEDFLVWIPERTVIVLGQSNEAESAVWTEMAEADGIPVIKRPSGGQTVILTPNTVVISVRLISERLENPRVYFKRVNDIILSALHGMGVENLGQKGISDITIGEKKILGSSIYRKKNLVFYHAVLNVAESPEFIGRYLKHPSREPDYRAGRKHEEFVTSLWEAGYPVLHLEIRSGIDAELKKRL